METAPTSAIPDTDSAENLVDDKALEDTTDGDDDDNEPEDEIESLLNKEPEKSDAEESLMGMFLKQCLFSRLGQKFLLCSALC